MNTQEDEDFIITLDTKLFTVVATIALLVIMGICGTIGYFVVRWLF